MARVAKAQREGKSADERFGMAIEFLERQPKSYAGGQRDELIEQMKVMQTQAPLLEQMVSAINEDGDECQGFQVFAQIWGNLEAAEPKKQREARRNDGLAALARASAAAEQLRRKHRKERLTRGLSEAAGTGTPEPPVLLIEKKQRRGARPKMGGSRIGGLPDLPPSVEWPMFGRKKLPFLAQIDLSELPKATRGQKSFRPPDGWLYAFGLFDNDPKHKPHPISVFIHRGPRTALRRAKVPLDKEIWRDWGKQRAYEPVPVSLQPKPKRDKRIGGGSYASLLSAGWLFGEMDDVFGSAGEVADEAFLDGDDWINLLAIESVGSMQGDSTKRARRW